MIRRPRRSALFPYTALFRSTVAPSGGASRVRYTSLVRLLATEGVPIPSASEPNWLTAGRYTAVSQFGSDAERSEEHTSELQSLAYLVCRLLLEKKKPRVRPC